MRMFDIINKKRLGSQLAKEEIEFAVNGFTNGTIPDFQMSALLMAICTQKLNSEETLNLTTAMANSGDFVDLSEFGNKTVDKHSTGGVGDKTTLIVAPIAAACGAVVAKMSGRGLGHTGGTIDKLESITGFCPEIPQKEFLEALSKNSLAVISQSGNLAPADKVIYALRDLTATVENHSLIASSIMSKKIAAGAKNIVLDVKCGNGAFMKDLDEATALAQEMVQLGKGANRRVCAVITGMDSPLGKNIGNSLEVIEAVDVLKGNVHNDLSNLSILLATKMVELALSISENDAKNKVDFALKSGEALRKFKEMIALQGGDVSLIENTNKFKKSEFSFDVVAQNNGFVSSVNAEKIGMASVALGAGRTKKDEKIDFAAGIVLSKKVGDKVANGEKIATLHSNKKDFLESNKLVVEAFQISQRKPNSQPLVLKIIQ